jgi:hypothetical protein
VIGLLAAAATVSALAPQWVRDGGRPPIESVMNAIEQCGLVRPIVEDDELVQDEFLRLSNETQASDEQLACVARVSFDSGYDLDLPAALRASYSKQYEQLGKPWGLELAREWLAKNKLLDGLQRFEESGLTEAQFAALLEHRCGRAARGMLSSEYGPHSIRPPSDDDFKHPKRLGKAVLCLGYSGLVADFSIGIIGNEKVAD